jgi:chromodomain-helicase-DNA-binding protein 4
LLRCTSVFWQIKSNTPVPDDIAEQGIPAGHAPAVRDINELLVELQELQNLEPIRK